MLYSGSYFQVCRWNLHVKTIEQYFHVVLFIMLFKETPCVWPFLKRKGSWTALSFDAVLFSFLSFWQSYQVWDILGHNRNISRKRKWKLVMILYLLQSVKLWRHCPITYCRILKFLNVHKKIVFFQLIWRRSQFLQFVSILQTRLRNREDAKLKTKTKTKNTHNTLQPIIHPG